MFINDGPTSSALRPAPVVGVRSILVFSNDPFAAALLGAAAELAGFAPHFALHAEAPREALLRTRPAVALVDCDHEQACTESFFGPALMAGARVVIFSSSRSTRNLEPIAEEFGVRAITLPIDVESLARVLGDAVPVASP